MNTLLTDEEISKVKADYANGNMDAGYKPEHFKQKNWGESAICIAQDLHTKSLLADEVRKIANTELADGYGEFITVAGEPTPEAQNLIDTEWQQELARVLKGTIDEKTGEQMLSRRTISLMRRDFAWANRFEILGKLRQRQADIQAVLKVIEAKE